MSFVHGSFDDYQMAIFTTCTTGSTLDTSAVHTIAVVLVSWWYLGRSLL